MVLSALIQELSLQRDSDEAAASAPSVDAPAPVQEILANDEDEAPYAVPDEEVNQPVLIPPESTSSSNLQPVVSSSRYRTASPIPEAREDSVRPEIRF